MVGFGRGFVTYLILTCVATGNNGDARVMHDFKQREFCGNDECSVRLTKAKRRIETQILTVFIKGKVFLLLYWLINKRTFAEWALLP